MYISVADASAKLDDLLQRVEAGDEVVITREGDSAFRLVPVQVPTLGERRRAAIKAVRASVAGKATPGPCAARSQDFLYDENGLPG